MNSDQKLILVVGLITAALLAYLITNVNDKKREQDLECRALGGLMIRTYRGDICADVRDLRK